MIISIIIASTGGRPFSREVIRSALNQDFPRDQFEVILVLDGCDEPSWCAEERTIAPCHFHVERASRHGQAACINRGLQIATGEIVLFLDDDILCPADLISKHVSAHEKNPGHLAFGPILTSPQSPDGLVADWTRRRNDLWFQQTSDEDTKTGWCFSLGNPNTSASRQLLLSAGPLDESFWRYNDTEFGFRLWQQGLRWVFIRDAVVAHIVDESLSDLAVRRAYEEGRAEVRLCRKHSTYRNFTLLGGICEGRNLRILARRALVRYCKATNLLLGPATTLANKFRRFSPVRNLGLRMISWRYLANFFRGAIDESGGWQKFRSEFAVRLPVLCYHRIEQPKAGEWYALSISPQTFERHLKWLRSSGWQSITPEQWSEWLDNGTPLPEKPILLTFDDGFAENTETCLPLLRKYGFVALTALVTGHVGETNAWDVQNELPEFRLMRASDAETWKREGMQFASHSESHPHLAELQDAELEHELLQSRDELAAVVGEKVHSFVYPFGEYNQRVAARTSEHYALAFTLNVGLNSIATPRHELRRLIISKDDSCIDLWFCTKFGRSPLRTLRKMLRK